MKKKNLYYCLTAIALLFGASACFQDLGQDPPLNYPDGHDGPENLGPLGEVFYMPFDDADFAESIDGVKAEKVGIPTVVAAGKVGGAYKGDTSTYLTYSLMDFPTLITTKLTAVFWYKMGSATRAGILACGTQPSDNRKFGFRFFREGGATNQTFKLNVGIETGEVWGDGGAAATLNPAVETDWVHFAFTIAEDQLAVYINGVEVKTANLSKPMSLQGCTAVSIGSGAPSFTEWSHLSDDSQIDELRFYNKVLSATEITDMYNASR